MPCKTDFHAHEWTKSGVLSIAKCETICNFCSSGKEYKPASALRKHVLTHIKNERLPLTLEHSVSGRPKKRARPPPGITQSDPATSIPSVTEPSAGAVTLTNTNSGPSSSFPDAPQQRPPKACWRCIIANLECSEPRGGSPCSQCLDGDPQPLCSNKPLDTLDVLILTDDFDFPAELYWQDYNGGLLRVTFAEEREAGKLSARQEQTLLPKSYTFQDDSVLRNIGLAATSYKSSISVTTSVISSGMILLTSLLKILIAVQDLSSRCGPYIIAGDPTDDRQREGVIICDQIPPIKTKLKEFLSSLNEQVFSPRLLEAISSAQSDIMVVGHAADLLQIFYGTLLLFIIRAILKAIFYGFSSDLHPSVRQAMQDPLFDNGWNCPLYQPMLHALECSEVSFERVLRGLTHDSDMYYHCETAAHLFPVRLDAFLIEHIVYFFEQFSPSSKDSIGLATGQLEVSAQIAQLGVLPMG